LAPEILTAGFPPGFLETLGDRMVLGRQITDEDNASTRPLQT
jgi:hypothetical protein